MLQGWSYRNMWWVTDNYYGAFTARAAPWVEQSRRLKSRDGSRALRPLRWRAMPPTIQHHCLPITHLLCIFLRARVNLESHLRCGTLQIPVRFCHSKGESWCPPRRTVSTQAESEKAGRYLSRLRWPCRKIRARSNLVFRGIRLRGMEHFQILESNDQNRRLLFG